MLVLPRLPRCSIKMKLRGYSTATFLARKISCRQKGSSLARSLTIESVHTRMRQEKEIVVMIQLFFNFDADITVFYTAVYRQECIVIHVML